MTRSVSITICWRHENLVSSASRLGLCSEMLHYWKHPHNYGDPCRSSWFAANFLLRHELDTSTWYLVTRHVEVPFNWYGFNNVSTSTGCIERSKWTITHHAARFLVGMCRRTQILYVPCHTIGVSREHWSSWDSSEPWMFLAWTLDGRLFTWFRGQQWAVKKKRFSIYTVASHFSSNATHARFPRYERNTRYISCKPLYCSKAFTVTWF